MKIIFCCTENFTHTRHEICIRELPLGQRLAETRKTRTEKSVRTFNSQFDHRVVVGSDVFNAPTLTTGPFRTQQPADLTSPNVTALNRNRKTCCHAPCQTYLLLDLLWKCSYWEGPRRWVRLLNIWVLSFTSALQWVSLPGNDANAKPFFPLTSPL